MKKIKLFFLAFLFVCLGLTSFSNAGTVADNISGVRLAYFTNVSLSSIYRHGIWDYGNHGAGTYCISFTSDTPVNLIMGFATSNAGSPSNTYLLYNNQYGNWVCLYANKSHFYAKLNVSHEDISVNFEVFKLNDLLDSSCGSSSDCSSVESALSVCQSSLTTLSGNLSTCQSDLSDCRGGQDASLLACIDQKEQCENSLTTLSGNYASLENMNSSLSSQLQECLENASNSTGELICNKFDLFWSSDNTDYSFPINNDLILPPGYKGFVNEGVLAIKKDSSLDSAYSIDDEEFQDVIDSYGVVFLYIFGSALFLVFLYMIRKYFIGLKS